MRAESGTERDDLDVGEDTVEDLDVEDADIQGGLTAKILTPPRPKY